MVSKVLFPELTALFYYDDRSLSVLRRIEVAVMCAKDMCVCAESGLKSFGE